MENAKINELVERLQADQLKKVDYVVPGSAMKMKQGKLVLAGGNADDFALAALLENSGVAGMMNEGSLTLDPIGVFHAQMSEKLNIPKLYYDRMLKDESSILDQNVNHWLSTNGKKYFVRCFVDTANNSGQVRALLSDSFKSIDNFDVLIAILAAIKQSGRDVKFDSGDLTNDKMFLRFVSPDVEVQAPELLKHYRVPGKGNDGNSGIMTGFVVTNSEVGTGAFTLSPRIVIGKCNNGMVFKSEQLWKSHIGAKLDEFSFIKWSEQTQEMNRNLIINQTQDVVKTFLSTEWLGAFVDKLSVAAGIEIIKPMQTMELVSKELLFSKEEQESLLNFFTTSGDSSLFGVSQAMTFLAQSVEPERRFELEDKATWLSTDVKIQNRVKELQLN